MLLPVALCSYLVVIVILARYARIITFSHRGRNFLYVLPFLLCFDNLATGIYSSLPSVPPPVLAVIVGLASALAAWSGLQVGLLARRHLSIRVLTVTRVGLLCFIAAFALP